MRIKDISDWTPQKVAEFAEFAPNFIRAMNPHANTELFIERIGEKVYLCR